MSGQNPESRAGAAKGTPKSSHDCHECEDWGTIVVPDEDGSGYGTEEPCPNIAAHSAGGQAAGG